MSISSFARVTRRVVSALVVSVAPSAQAEVRIDRSAEAFIELSISGTITDDDAETFAGLSRELEYKNAFIDLNSEGGNVFAAMKIGKLIRKYDASTIVEGSARCFTSCALIFIAGVQRHNIGELGLHRPYFAAAPQSRETIEKQVPLMLSMVKGYIAEIGVTDDFYYQMVNTARPKERSNRNVGLKSIRWKARKM
jgi:hypothetical protein